MTSEKKPVKLVFAPGCFDDFEGTQEELDALVKEIQDGFDNGDFFKKARPVDFDELTDEEINEIEAKFQQAVEAEEGGRLLQ